MFFDGAGTEVEAIADLSIGAAFDQFGQDFLFADGEVEVEAGEGVGSFGGFWGRFDGLEAQSPFGFHELRSLQQIPDYGSQFIEFKGFGQVGIAAQLVAANAFFGVGAGGEENDGQEAECGFAAHLADKLIAVHLGHGDIGDDQMGLILIHHFEAMLSVFRRNYRVASKFQVIADG